MKKLIVLLILLLVSSAQAAERLTLDKGPYLLWQDGSLTVRIEATDLAGPTLELREGELLKRRPFTPDKKHLWQAHFDEGMQAIHYRVVDGERLTDWMALNIVPSTTQNLTFAVYGDNRSGGGNSQIHQSILKAMHKERPAFIMTTGDNVYKGNKEAHWKQFFDEGRPVFAAIPLFPAMGNHDESHNDRFGQLFPIGKGRNYYAFQFGPAYFIALDSTVKFDPKSEQYKFLKDQLDEWRGKSPIFVYFHHPPFSGGKHGPNKRVIKYLVPLFEDYGVDIVFAGHDHDYQRIGPINGVLYIVTGGGGGPLYKVMPHPAIADYKVMFHYVSIQLDGNSIRGSMKTKQGIVEDSFEFRHDSNPIPKEQRSKHPKLRSSRFRLFN